MELIIDNISKSYGKIKAVNEVSLTLQQGIYGLLGPNGAGKTTLMQMICGILKPTKGSVSLGSMDVSKPEFRCKLGYLPQEFKYYPEFTASEFLHYMACLKGLTKQHATQKSSELLELVSLNDVASRKVKTYSKGMKQRLGIAQSLLNDPGLLILDEPTAGLDPKERIRFRGLIAQLGTDRIVLLSTHIVSDIDSVAHIALMMKSGHIVENGTVDELIDTLNGKVFECTVENETALSLSEKYPVVNVRFVKGMTCLRLIADELPCKGAECVHVTLEDVYLHHFAG